MRHKERPAIRTQFIIFNLFGDYVNLRGGTVWTSGLLEVLGVLGVSERAARSTLSRMKHNGWLESTKIGRRSMYTLTEKGKSLLSEGSERLFEPRPVEWDGCWHLVTYSLPQDKRALRQQFKKRLSWLGYGMLEPGTMIASFARKERVITLIDELKVDGYVHFFTKAHLEQLDHKEIVSKCWDLETLNEQYEAFIEKHRPNYKALRDRYQDEGNLSAQDSFTQRFWATFEFSAFPRQDPNLPGELLPADWRGSEAVEFISTYRDLLRKPSETFVSESLGLEPLTSAEHDPKDGILVR